MATFDVNSTGKDVVAKLGGKVEGKTIIVTGPSPGSLGAELITDIAAGAKPAKIILVGRNEAKTAPVVENIRKANPSVEVSFVQADLASNSSVRAAADKIKSLTSTVDILVNCAGIMGVREYTTSADGIEMHFAANHVGHFLLTNLLVDELAAAKGHVVNVTSMGYMLSEVDTEDPNFDGGKKYATWPAYARSKTANIVFSHGLAAKYKSKGITSVAADPGLVADTQLQANQGVDHAFLMEGFKLATERNGGVEPPHSPPVSLQQGAGALLVGVLGDYTAPSTAMLHDAGPIPAMPYATDSKIAEDLWKLSEKLVGQTFA